MFSFKIKTYTREERLHGVPHLYFLGSRCLHPMERDQADKSRAMKRRLQQAVGDHWTYQTADGLVNTGLSIVSFREYFDKSALVGGANCLEVVPPIVSVVQESLNCLRLKFLFQTCLSFDYFLCQELLATEGRHKIDIHCKHAERTLMRLTDW